MSPFFVVLSSADHFPFFFRLKEVCEHDVVTSLFILPGCPTLLLHFLVLGPVLQVFSATILSPFNPE